MKTDNKKITLDIKEMCGVDANRLYRWIFASRKREIKVLTWASLTAAAMFLLLVVSPLMFFSLLVAGVIIVAAAAISVSQQTTGNPGTSLNHVRQ